MRFGRQLRILIKLIVILVIISGCSAGKNASATTFTKKVEASYYADSFNGKKTASGERFNNNKLTAAHRKLSFGTKVRVTNLANGKSVVVEITDRGPSKKSREIDMSRRAFMEISDSKNHGILMVKLEVLK